MSTYGYTKDGELLKAEYEQMQALARWKDHIRKSKRKYKIWVYFSLAVEIATFIGWMLYPLFPATVARGILGFGVGMMFAHAIMWQKHELQELEEVDL